ncbi:MAG: hypothetical protein AAF581_10570 [Planctomycetota bacterium]
MAHDHGEVVVRPLKVILITWQPERAALNELLDGGENASAARRDSRRLLRVFEIERAGSKAVALYAEINRLFSR